MMTVHEVSRITGLSIRTLQYYDKIDLLKPTNYSKAGYRLYGDTELEKLQQIMLFRELEFPLKEIKEIVNGTDFDKRKALDQQIELLELKKEHIDNLIGFARTIRARGVNHIKLDFSAFDRSKLDEYFRRAKEMWNKTPQYKEFTEKSKNWTKQDEDRIMDDFMKIFEKLGKIRKLDPASDLAQKYIQEIKDFITDHLYTCTNEILYGLGKVYAGGGEFTENIDKIGGKGTCEFTYQAIKIYCEK